jgi:hypothetical protein
MLAVLLVTLRRPRRTVVQMAGCDDCILRLAGHELKANGQPRRWVEVLVTASGRRQMWDWSEWFDDEGEAAEWANAADPVLH